MSNPFLTAIEETPQDNEVYSAEDVIMHLNSLAIDEVEKIATAQGYDFDALDTEDIEELVVAYIEDQGGYEKLAEMNGFTSADDDYYEEDDMEKLAASAQQFGAIAGQAMLNQLEAAQASPLFEYDIEKVASLDHDDFDEVVEKLAFERAEFLLQTAYNNAAAYNNGIDMLDEEDVEKLAAENDLEDILHARALEMIEEGGFDVDTVLDLANNEF